MGGGGGRAPPPALSESQLEGLDAAGVDQGVLLELPVHVRVQVLEQGRAAARRRRLQAEREARSAAWGQARVAHVPSAEKRDEMQARQLAAAALPPTLSMATALAAQERILRGIQRQRTEEATAGQQQQRPLLLPCSCQTTSPLSSGGGTSPQRRGGRSWRSTGWMHRRAPWGGGV